MDQIKKTGSGGDLEVSDQMLHAVLQLPHKILRHHDVDNLAQLVLHELGHEALFGLNKAAYLVDNPEFNCVKGIAGYCKDECGMHPENVWETPHVFVNDMKAATFNNTIKQFVQDTSVRRHGVDVHHPGDLVELGLRLGLKNPSFFTWNMRHDNHGILLFEEGQAICARRRDILHHAAALLSLC